VNCGAIPENLMEAEFFGVKKGAYTGAGADRDGFFQAAHRGTLLLDEVADLPLGMQVKLLRVLQERTVRRVGSMVEEPVDVRIVAASHKSLPQLVSTGQFRQDLYYRLNVMMVYIPPLRDRAGDAVLLAERWLQRHSQGKTLGLGSTATHWLKSHPFPGNVRELENVLERAVALCMVQESSTIGIEHLQSPIIPEMIGVISSPPPLVSSNNTASTVMTPSAPAATSAIKLPIDLPTHLNSIERSLIELALNQTRYNRTQAATLLGLNLRQLRYRIEQLGIDN
jgi:two-component system response regulator PilR (NtrC family)